MGLFDTLLDNLATRIGADIQGRMPSQKFRDYRLQGESYSVEAEVSEALANLMLMDSSMPVMGTSERALWLDGVSDDFMRAKASAAVSTGFLTGDCIVVPSYNGRGIVNVVVGSDDFEILACNGDEITSCSYVVDSKLRNNERYTLLQVVDLVGYEANDGTSAYANRYRMFVARNGALLGTDLSKFPEWERLYENEWYVPNVDRLLVARFKSHTVDHSRVNSIKGVPVCYGASEPISEIHYLLDQMHNEFHLSEKMIIADKRFFKKEFGRDGVASTVLPRGKERLFMDVRNTGTESVGIHDWSPEVRYQAYLDAIDKQEKLVERAVGVSSGIISTPNDLNYQNVDNVRKSQQKTIGFINTARKQAEKTFAQLVYIWDTLANYHGINAQGDYELVYDWSDEYIETFADKQAAILAGESIGATDAVDYRMFVYGEAPDVAKSRVEEIKAAKPALPVFGD